MTSARSTTWWNLKQLFAPRLRPLRTRGLYVLGMHRSGTSCLAGLLETAGLYAGNVRGLFEDRSIRLLNKDLLAHSGGTWREPPERIQVTAELARRVRQALQPFSEHAEWLLKDPRFLLTFEAWSVHTPQHRLVGTFRHPLSVGHSLCRRDQKLRDENRRADESPLSVEEGVAIWCRYNRSLIRLHRERRFPIIDFDQTGTEYLSSLRTLFEQLDLNYADAAINERYSIDRISNRFADSQLEGEPAEIYRYLQEHAVR